MTASAGEAASAAGEAAARMRAAGEAPTAAAVMLLDDPSMGRMLAEEDGIVACLPEVERLYRDLGVIDRLAAAMLRKQAHQRDERQDRAYDQ